jgi:hypothetical protein
MTQKLREAVSFMDLKKRMANKCAVPEIDETEAEYLLHQIRKLS